ncbi:MAG TPA: PAS domain S-box protein [Candidatus Wallbacteria bacterium]|mgnify:CR=1 FL=1|nr:PAS domain S-box protein [Candidatus Wallbacteria bacterium]
MKDKIIEIIERYNELSIHSRAVTWEVDADGLYTYVNDASKIVYGMEPESIIGKKYFYDLHPEKGRESFKNTMLDIFSHRKPFTNFENEVELPGGETIWVSTNGIPIIDGEGNFSGYRGTDMDITERKRAEEKLRESENLYKTLVSHLPQKIFIKDTQSVYLACNDEYAKYLGIAPEDIKGKNDFDFHPPIFATSYRADDRQVIQSGKIIELEEKYIMSGEEKWAHTIKVPYTDSENNIIGLLGVFEDITERKLAGEKIRLLLAEKELLLKEVHHRIKNNMNIVTSVMFLRMESLKEPGAKSALKDAISRVKSMMVLYDKLYRSNNFNELSFREYIESIVNEVVDNFPNKNIVKMFKIIDNVMIDAKILPAVGIIINELLTNIMKYAFNGRESGSITVSGRASDNRVTIAVQDDGIGLPESIDASNPGGFGLELVHMMTRSLKGDIKIERGGGTKFVIEFDL